MIYRVTTPETDRVYRKLDTEGLSNYSNLSTVGFEPQTSCMAVRQPNHYTKIARPIIKSLEYDVSVLKKENQIFKRNLHQRKLIDKALVSEILMQNDEDNIE